MLVTYFRSSSLANFNFCEMQYYINYVLGIERTAGQKAEMGTILHKVMECLALFKQETQLHNRNDITINDEICHNYTIAQSDLFNNNIIETVLNKVFEYYVKKSTYNYTESNYNTILSWIYTVLSYNNGIFDPRKRTIKDVEKKFDISIDKDWAKYKYDNVEGNLCIKGTIDLVTQIDDKTLEIIDWKTGQRKDWATGEEKTYEKLCKDQQLRLYYWAARKIYPEIESVLLTIFFIRDGGPFTLCFDEHTLGQVEEDLRATFEKVKRNNMPKMISYTQSSFKCTKLCDYYKNAHPESKNGDNICRFIHNEIKRIGIASATKKYTAENHNVDNYSAPGE